MNIEIKDIAQILINIKMLNQRLNYLTKQLDKNKIKYPIGMTYDQLYNNIMIVNKENAKREFKIVKIA